VGLTGQVIIVTDVLVLTRYTKMKSEEVDL